MRCFVAITVTITLATQDTLKLRFSEDARQTRLIRKTGRHDVGLWFESKRPAVEHGGRRFPMLSNVPSTRRPTS